MSADEDPTDAIDRYRLSRIHSEGGLGRVWLARDPEVGRDVALKELLVEQAKDPNARARFLTEAQITGQLEHPNIVPVYDVGELDDDNRPFYTMRFVRGPTLADTIREHATASGNERSQARRRRELLRALCSIGNAVAHAHSRGVIHRDLKPENVVLGPHGELIVLDWGLAKRMKDTSPDVVNHTQPKLKATNDGSVMGTIAYMSPEQAEGTRPDERTDIYGLGAILFEVLTGKPPHHGNNAVDVLRKIKDGATPRARGVDSRVPLALDAVCAKAMAKQQQDRYATAAEFVEELESWLADEPVSVLPDTLFTGLARWLRRHQALAYTVGAALLLIGVVATIAAIQLGASAERERGLHQRSMQVSARLAARALGSEIDVRWSALDTRSRSAIVRRTLAATNGDDADLQTWLVDEFADFQRTTDAVSWFVQDRHGVQRARAPFSETSVGKSYAFRDYFHGRGKDLSPGSVDIAPIERPHLSGVFRSQVTQNLMVAFTVPIRSDDDAQVLGVFGMTVELGQGLFRCLRELGLDDDQLAVLVETRDDWTGKPGLVLQHPELVRLRARREQLQMAHVPEDFLRPFGDDTAGMLRDYRDAMAGDYEGHWLAAFEHVSARRGDGGSTGWVVMIQERAR